MSGSLTARYKINNAGVSANVVVVQPWAPMHRDERTAPLTITPSPTDTRQTHLIFPQPFNAPWRSILSHRDLPLTPATCSPSCPLTGFASNMEDIHGVDVSWLHHSTRGAQPQNAGSRPHALSGAVWDCSPSSHLCFEVNIAIIDHHRPHASSSASLSQNVPPATSLNGDPHRSRSDGERKTSTPPAPVKTSLPASPPPVASPPPQKTPVKRPPLLSRGSSEKAGNGTPQSDTKTNSRRNSWISSLSSKFSSQNSPAQTTHAQAQGSPAAVNGGHGGTSANGALNGIQAANKNQADLEPYVPQHPRGSFLQNAIRRLSSGPQVATLAKMSPQGGVCPRKVMNIDPNRNRCLVRELDQNKLRRVAFCVDVEIAGGPRYKDEADSEERKKKSKDRKLKEKGEGEALKHPEALAVEKEKEGAVIVNNEQEKEIVGTAESPNPEGTVVEEEKKDSSRKKEKKKRSEAERKERKEKKRRKAEENGCIPLELSRDEESGSTDPATATSDPATARPQCRPTTDPLRIYKRCCQLRETPPLKRISTQLADPKACSLVTPGVVTCLDLTGSRMQTADIVTLSDWLAVVPVRKLLLEDADLNDEKLRVILAGLLAAKIPDLNRLPGKTNNKKHEERAGIILKLVLKNNPKIGPEGWKHISLFIYLCKSIQAIDVSMIPFPNARTASNHHVSQGTPGSPTPQSKPPKTVADIFSKAISTRLAGPRLEELVMAECAISASSIRKIIDSVIISGVQRLSLAGNSIDSEGLDHVIHYIKSGVCQGLDLGGNDLRDAIECLAESVTDKCPLWALSLADCNLTPESLKILFPALVKLPTFRFLDLSHNQDLFQQKTSLCLLRKYMPQFTELKRIHLMDVSLSPEQTIGLAEILPECAHLAHVNILENPLISNVATATDEATQEEAAALYASLMVAAKLSRTLICIDVDVPGPDSNEVVKALAKQVVAFCLRNMETFSEIPELKEGAKPVPKEVEYPSVLRHLVIDGVKDAEADPPAADDAYIVGGTGVVKALSYCLLQKATDLRRASVTASGTVTPTRSHRVDSTDGEVKAREMSKDLLEGARGIRARLQPALVREARAGNDMGYRRLLFLDQTLQGMIQRFEDEYPETRLPAPDDVSAHSSILSSSPPAHASQTLVPPAMEPADTVLPESDDEEEPRALRSRHNSDVSLASRALSLEEGRLHRLGHRVRTELMNASRESSPHPDRHSSSLAITIPTSQSPTHHADFPELPEHWKALREKLESYSGEDIRRVTETVGWEKAFDQLVENAAELKDMMRSQPEEFARFRETQIAALRNRNPGVEVKKDMEDDEVAVED